MRPVRDHLPNVHFLLEIHRSPMRQAAAAANEIAKSARLRRRERFEVALHRALMLLALVWLARPIARIGCCEPPQQNGRS